MSGPWTAAFLSLWVLVALMALVMIGLVRRVAALTSAGVASTRNLRFQPQGIEPGRSVPFFSVEDARTGETLASTQFQGSPVVYLLLEADCQPCQKLAQHLESATLRLASETLIILDKRGTFDLVRRARLTFAYQQALSVTELLRTNATPYAFAVDETGVVVDAGVVNSSAELERLTTVAAYATRRSMRSTDEIQRSPEGGSGAQDTTEEGRRVKEVNLGPLMSGSDADLDEEEDSNGEHGPTRIPAATRRDAGGGGRWHSFRRSGEQLRELITRPAARTQVVAITAATATAPTGAPGRATIARPVSGTTGPATATPAEPGSAQRAR